MGKRKEASTETQKLIEDYLTMLRAGGLRDATLNTRRVQLVRMATKAGDPLAITEGELTKWMGEQKWAAETRKSQRTACMGFFAWMKRSGKRVDDPAENLPKVRSPKPEARPCPDRFVIAALQKADEEEEIMVRLAAEYGLRRGEISQVSSLDVIDDLTGKTLLVHGKGGKIGYVPLEDDMAELLLKHDGFVFPGRFGGHVEVSYVGKRLSRLLPEGWSGHTLRHRFATTTYDVTHDILLVCKALRHESVATTQRYVAFPTARMREAITASKIGKAS